MAAEKEHIVIFENVSASVGGYDISSIVELSLTAATNSIPQITLLVDAGMSGGVDQTYVDEVSLDNAKSILDTCRGMVKKDGATLDLSITCSDVGPAGGGSETLRISGWLLANVSLSPMQRGDSCMVMLTFQHPLCKAHFGGAVPSVLGALPDLEGVSGGNPLAVFVSALGTYANVYRESPLPAQVEGSSDAQSVRDALIRHLEKATSNLESSLTWSGGGLPAENHLGEWGDLLVKGLSSYALPDGGTSVFQTFVSRVVPECSLAIGGDYTKSSLDVKPFTPWEEASVTLDESNIFSLSFPSSDPSPLSGVKVIMNASESETFVTFQPISCQSPDSGKPAEAFYVPESQLSADYLYGPIQLVSEPGWLAQMAAYGSPVGDTYMSDAVQAQQGSMTTATTAGRAGTPKFSGGGGQAPAIDYANAIMACAKAYYETSLMKDWEFIVTARFMPESGGIYPGKVLSVSSKSGEVMGGYITAVEHTISVSSKAAHTRVICTHPRFGALPDGISGGTNALYS